MATFIARPRTTWLPHWNGRVAAHAGRTILLDMPENRELAYRVGRLVGYRQANATRLHGPQDPGANDTDHTPLLMVKHHYEDGVADGIVRYEQQHCLNCDALLSEGNIRELGDVCSSCVTTQN